MTLDAISIYFFLPTLPLDVYRPAGSDLVAAVDMTSIEVIAVFNVFGMNLIVLFVLYACFATNIDVVLLVKGVFDSLTFFVLRPRLSPKRVGHEGLYCFVW